MKIDPTLFGTPAETLPPPLPLLDQPPVQLTAVNLQSPPVYLNQPIPAAPALDKVEIITALPARREKPGYRHGGIND